MAKTRKEIIPRRGEVYLANFDPAVGSEIRKTRPGLVLQNDIANRKSPVTIMAAISTKFSESLYPTEVLISPPEGGLRKPCVTLLNQIRTVDKKRLIKKLGTVRLETMRKINRALAVSLGLIEI